jgi:hypothetical protein
MRLLRWMSLAGLLSLTACSAKGGSGYSGPSDSDGSTKDTGGTPDGSSEDSAVDPDGAVVPDVPVDLDGTVTPDVPVGPDGTVTPDVPVGPDGTATPDVPVLSDVGPSCGDRICNGEESCTTCARDCGECPPPPDVPVELFCGDGMCSASRLETCTSCPSDCGACPARCGDGTCNTSETCTSCPGDCGACPARCGDGTCNTSETCTTCPTDCGACPVDPCASAGTICSTCALLAGSGCGWCSNASRCVTGTSSGPSSTVAGCSATAGTWVRSTSSCGGTTADPTVACAGTYSGTARECSWRRAGTYTCTPGRSYTVGCNNLAGTSTLCSATLGSCTGDPVMRVCSGSATCSETTALSSADDTCGTVPAGASVGRCPVVSVVCPTSGQITVLTGNYSDAASGAGTCTPSLR